MARICVFCGGSPTTQEHVFPDWARRLVKAEGPQPHTQNTFRDRHEPVSRSWSKDAYSMTVRAVCATCNNGWMAALEEQAKAFLDPMFHGRGRALHQVGQKTLATWALKTAMMAEQTHGSGPRGFPPAEYAYLYERGEPSERMRVWMVSYAGDILASANVYGLDADMTRGSWRHVGLQQSDERKQRDIYGGTISFGPVVFQVFGTTLSPLLQEDLLDPPEIVVQIWPYQTSFTWMPRPALDDWGLLQFGTPSPSDSSARLPRAHLPADDPEPRPVPQQTSALARQRLGSRANARRARRSRTSLCGSPLPSRSRHTDQDLVP